MPEDKNDIDRVMALFNQINAIPRPPYHLEKIHGWLEKWAQERGFQTESDEALNLLIRLPASAGYEDSPMIILQAHMDMVCEKDPDSKHDFHRDPIISWRDDLWVGAKGTSLGADNGIAIALFLELLNDPHREHPPLEILLTSDEETGLEGAQKLKPGFLKGRILLNLDSEEDGHFTIGCASGRDTQLFFPLRQQRLPQGYTARSLRIDGLEGGHSGMEIHLGRANANVLLLRVLRETFKVIPEARFGNVQGGTVHNAIARTASALVAVPSDFLDRWEETVQEITAILRSENAVVEKNLAISLQPTEFLLDDFFHPDDTEKLLDVLCLIPHGIQSLSHEFEDMIELSVNFATLRTEKNQVSVLTNQRSSVSSHNDNLSESLFSLMRLYGGTYRIENEHPSWLPRKESKLLERCKKIWKELFVEDALIDIVHAGLECGAIGTHYPDLDMISFGPSILQAHSPKERVYLPSVGRTRDFLRQLLKSYKG